MGVVTRVIAVAPAGVDGDADIGDFQKCVSHIQHADGQLRRDKEVKQV